jgi:hypothetical protein
MTAAGACRSHVTGRRNTMLRRKLGLAGALAIGLAVGFVVAGQVAPRAVGQGAAVQQAGPKYTVVETDILSALVVDNSTNTVYFYTVEKDAAPGSDLHLRGSLDLNQVGQPVLKPRKAGGAEKENK